MRINDLNIQKYRNTDGCVSTVNKAGQKLAIQQQAQHTEAKRRMNDYCDSVS